MLMALLYCEDDRIGGAAMACDQTPFGDGYWTSQFEGVIEKGAIFETAYVMVNNVQLQKRLLRIGIDDQVDGREMAFQVEQSYVPSYLNRAA